MLWSDTLGELELLSQFDEVAEIVYLTPPAWLVSLSLRINWIKWWPIMVLEEMVILIKLQFGFGADFFCITWIKNTQNMICSLENRSKNVRWKCLPNFGRRCGYQKCFPHRLELVVFSRLGLKMTFLTKISKKFWIKVLVDKSKMFWYDSLVW